MAQQNRHSSDLSTEVQREPTVRVLVVEEAPDLSAILAAFPGLAVSSADGLAACDQALGADRFAVVVLNPELGRAWPTAIAEQAIEVVAGRAALLVVCRTPDDEQAVGSRIGDQASVVSRAQLQPARLVDIVRGVAGARGAASC